jgi:N-methylhydantoinase A
LKAPLDGPCIVEEYDTTCLVPPGWTATLDRHGNIVLRYSSSRTQAHK